MTEGPAAIASMHEVTTRSLIFDMAGTPAPQGSKTFKGFRGGKPILVESCAAVKPWRHAVATAARTAMLVEGWTMLIGPVTVGIEFFLTRPVSAPKSRVLPDRRPDLDKLVRAVLDALTTAGVYEDDSRVVRVEATKVYANEFAGARVTVTSG
jgi:Holliday junction resolvase RusA-like endonuclease